MAYRRKIVTAVLAALGLILLAGVGAAKLLLNEERLAAFARDRVKTALGRELIIGELSLQFRPLPTVRLTNTALGNPSWSKEAYFLHADSATARMDLTALLRGRLEIASLSIEGLKANLEVSPENRGNWQMQSKLPDRPGGEALVAPLHLASLHLKDAQIRYARHGEPAREWRIDELNAQADSGWRNAEIEARILQNGAPLVAKARFADLSAIGQDAAVSEGEMEFLLGSGRLKLAGALPIGGSLKNHKLRLELASTSAREIFGFFGLSGIDLAPIQASVDLEEAQGGVQASNLSFRIGRLRLTGDALIRYAGGKPTYHAKLETEHLDWAQTMRDLGRPELPPKPPGQLFRDTPLGWRAVAALQSVSGKIDLGIRRVKLRSGIELQDLRATIDASEKLLNIDKFSFLMLDGRANGSLALEGNKRTAKLRLETQKVSLGKWLAARGHKMALSDGPVDLSASVSGSGLSMQDLAESLTGPVRISVGPAKLHSKQIQQAETWLIGLAPVFSATETEYVNLACISAYLPFEKGRAAAEPIAGIRSDASQLLASGYVDLKERTLDLRGQVRARSGVSLGIASISGGNLKIAGRIDKPAVGLDPDGTPGALARIGAAIMTSGVSILATALWDAANPSSDPCQITLREHEGKKQKRRPGSGREIAAKKSELAGAGENYP